MVIHSVKRDIRTLRPLNCDVSLSANFHRCVNIHIPDLQQGLTKFGPLVEGGLQIPFQRKEKFFVRLSPRKFALRKDYLIPLKTPQLTHCDESSHAHRNDVRQRFRQPAPAAFGEAIDLHPKSVL